LDDDGIAHVKCEFPAAELQESVEDAEAMCPTDAIEVTREAGA
jgi:ferredoxin